MNCLLELLSTKQLDKITVKDICEICEINRNTFYYYFRIFTMYLMRYFRMRRRNLSGMSMKELPFMKRSSDALRSYLPIKGDLSCLPVQKGDILKGYLSKIAEDCVGRYVEKRQQAMI